MSRLLVCSLCLCACFVLSARAQTTVTVTPPSAFAEQLADRLRAGLATDENARVTISTESAPTSCGVLRDASASERTIDVNVTSDSRVVVCARSPLVARERSVGPVAVLDAAVVEQVATMVEATLDAMDRRNAALAEPVTVTEQAPQSAEASPDDATARTPETPSAPPHATTDAREAQPAADDSHADVALGTRETAADAEADADASAAAVGNALEGYSVTFGVEPIWWVDRALTAGVRVGGQRVIAPPWFWFAIDVAYALPFGEQSLGLGADFSTLAVDTRLGYSVPLSATWTFDLAAGPRVEWLFVQPFAVKGSGATAGKGSTIFAAAATVDVGPRVQLTSRWFVALRVGAVFVNQPRAFGFTSPEGFVTILDQAMPRLFARVEARVAL